MKLNIAILSGDGIGPEIMKQGVAVLDAIATKRLLLALDAGNARPQVILVGKDGNVIKNDVDIETLKKLLAEQFK